MAGVTGRNAAGGMASLLIFFSSTSLSAGFGAPDDERMRLIQLVEAVDRQCQCQCELLTRRKARVVRTLTVARQTLDGSKVVPGQSSPAQVRDQ